MYELSGTTYGTNLRDDVDVNSIISYSGEWASRTVNSLVTYWLKGR
jgi:hypothetical protein